MDTHLVAQIVFAAFLKGVCQPPTPPCCSASMNRFKRIYFYEIPVRYPVDSSMRYLIQVVPEPGKVARAIGGSL